MANSEHLEILKQGVEVWNKWRKENPDERPDFSGADLSGLKIICAGLKGANFREGILEKAIFAGSTLVEANFRRANLRGADLSNTKLMKADFSGADLRDAKFVRADLTEANLREADLNRADLRGALLNYAYFTRANLIKANFKGSFLRGTSLWNAILEETNFYGAVIRNIRIRKRDRLEIAKLFPKELEGLSRIQEYKRKGRVNRIFAAPFALSIELKKVTNEIENEFEKVAKKGKIMFNPPEEMKVHKKERIEVRISQNIKEDLTKKLKGRGFPQIEDIFVGSVMKAQLLGEDFKIESLSEPEQSVTTSGYTQWEWNVTALKAGIKVLCLSISISIILKEFGEKKISLPVMEKNIYVKVNLPRSFLIFVRKKWIGIISIIISLLGLLIAYKELIEK